MANNRTRILKFTGNAIIFLGLCLSALLAFSMLPVPGNIKLLSVLSGSMEPAIATGSAVLISPSASYEKGDVITFSKDIKTDMPITHRIVQVEVTGEEFFYTTKGDANNTPDSLRVPAADVVGKVRFSVPYLGYGLTFLKTPLGFLFAVVVPAAAVILDEGLKIFRELTKKENKSVKEAKFEVKPEMINAAKNES